MPKSSIATIRPPKIKLFAVTKRMALVCGPFTALDAEQDEQLVARIHNGVNALSCHCRGACKASCNELGNSDDAVSSRRPVNSNRFFSSHSVPFGYPVLCSTVLPYHSRATVRMEGYEQNNRLENTWATSSLSMSERRTSFFDIAILVLISLSIVLVMLESVPLIRESYGGALRIAEWIFTILFTIEYLVRIYAARKRLRYMVSFFGIVDLLAILPGYLSLFLLGSQYLIVVRSLRLLRVFRILKLARFLGEASVLRRALSASTPKITVFLGTVVTVVLIVGALMYVVEGEKHGFTSIPVSIYWAIVTLTTVGYGDISPQTPLGQTLSAFVMIIGYGIIAVPTGILTSELSRAERESNPLKCTECDHSDHDDDATHCKYCGTELESP